MRIDKVLTWIRKFMLWMYIAAVVTGLIHAVYTGQETKTPGEIIYEKNHTR